MINGAGENKTTIRAWNSTSDPIVVGIYDFDTMANRKINEVTGDSKEMIRTL